MSEKTALEDFITENELITKFGLKTSTVNQARKKHALPCYQISQQGPRLYLKSEVTDYFISCRKVIQPKSSAKRSIRRTGKA